MTGFRLVDVEDVGVKKILKEMEIFRQSDKFTMDKSSVIKVSRIRRFFVCFQLEDFVGGGMMYRTSPRTRARLILWGTFFLDKSGKLQTRKISRIFWCRLQSLNRRINRNVAVFNGTSAK